MPYITIQYCSIHINPPNIHYYHIISSIMISYGQVSQQRYADQPAAQSWRRKRHRSFPFTPPHPSHPPPPPHLPTPLPPLYLALLELNSHGGWYQTRLQIRSSGLAAASERANRGPGRAVVGVRIWNVDRITAGRNALTCPSVPAVDQTQSSHLNPTGAGFLCCRCQAPGARVSGPQANVSPSPLAGRHTLGPRC